MKIFLLALLALTGTFQLTAQNKLVESNSIIGIWRQVVPIRKTDSLVKLFKTNNYKVINTDGTYFTLLTTGKELVKVSKDRTAQELETNIGHYGTYTKLSDSSYTEHIIKHGIKSEMNGTNAEIRYKLLNKNLVLLKYKSGEKWIPEFWQRVTLIE